MALNSHKGIKIKHPIILGIYKNIDELYYICLVKGDNTSSFNSVLCMLDVIHFDNYVSNIYVNTNPSVECRCPLKSLYKIYTMEFPLKVKNGTPI